MPLTRDTALVAGVAVWVLVVLGLDTGASLGQQWLLGLGTWALLLLALRGESRATRIQVGVVVAFATVVEYVFAGWLGVYVYRLENVPAFVPPGHGLIYLAAFAMGRSAWAHRHRQSFVLVTLAVGGCWAVWGVTLSDRPDVLGAIWFGCLLLFAWKGKSPLLYAGAFLVVSYLEIVGTSLGTWAWQPTDPTGLITIGNPPSGIAGGYAWFDAAALYVAPRLMGRWDRRRAGPVPRPDRWRAPWRTFARRSRRGARVRASRMPTLPSMARGRHQRSGRWLGRLRPGRSPFRPRRRSRDSLQQQAVAGLRADLTQLEAEVVRLRVLGTRHAGAAAAADARARSAQEQLGAARGELAALHTEIAALRTDLSALREELVWAFAERKLEVDVPAPIVDLQALDEEPAVATSA